MTDILPSGPLRIAFISTNLVLAATLGPRGYFTWWLAAWRRGAESVCFCIRHILARIYLFSPFLLLYSSCVLFPKASEY